jgi:hypothetical protein
VLGRQDKILVLHSEIRRYEMTSNDFRQSIRKCAQLESDRLVELISPNLIGNMWLWHALSAPRSVITVIPIIGAPRP